MKFEKSIPKRGIKMIPEKQLMLKLTEVLAEQNLISPAEKARVLQKIREDDNL